jgi:hypothetical protein
VERANCIAEHFCDDRRNYARQRGYPDAAGRFRTDSPRSSQGMKPPSRQSDYATENYDTRPTHQRHSPAKFGQSLWVKADE